MKVIVLRIMSAVEPLLAPGCLLMFGGILIVVFLGWFVVTSAFSPLVVALIVAILITGGFLFIIGGQNT